jgi:hypothetical protein
MSSLNIQGLSSCLLRELVGIMLRVVVPFVRGIPELSSTAVQLAVSAVALMVYGRIWQCVNFNSQQRTALRI